MNRKNMGANRYTTYTAKKQKPIIEVKTMFKKKKKNIMYVYYNVDHLSSDEADRLVRELIFKMIGKFYKKYTVNCIISSENDVRTLRMNENTDIVKMRADQIQANSILRSTLKVNE